jgi:high-affinity Fe2+/Pb2+ permease
MSAEMKRLRLEAWMSALGKFKIRLRKCLRIVLASGIPLSVVRQAVSDILDDLQARETD